MKFLKTLVLAVGLFQSTASHADIAFQTETGISSRWILVQQNADRSVSFIEMKGKSNSKAIQYIGGKKSFSLIQIQNLFQATAHELNNLKSGMGIIAQAGTAVMFAGGLYTGAVTKGSFAKGLGVASGIGLASVGAIALFDRGQSIKDSLVLKMLSQESLFSRNYLNVQSAEYGLNVLNNALRSIAE